MIFLLCKMEKMSWEIIRNSVGEELQTWGISASQVKGIGKMSCEKNPKITCLCQLISIKLQFQFVAVSQICHFTEGPASSALLASKQGLREDRKGHRS